MVNLRNHWRAISVTGVVICAIVVGVLIARSSGSAAAAASRQRWFVCTKTGQAFQANLEIGMRFPIHSPFSGENTGMPAELCSWTADGGIRKDPVPVLLNSDIGSPEPTFCPDCGRLVVGRNPPAVEGRTPPPTRDEYQASKPRR